MTIGRIALRIITIEALRGRTSVSDNVLDSQIASLDFGANGQLKTDQEKPFISVYTETSKADDLSSGRQLWRNGLTELLLETGIAISMTEPDTETGASTIGGIPPTDAAFELFLDTVDREISVALTDPRNVWGELWRTLVRDVARVERKRVADAETGTRMAAHQQCLICDLLPDPVYGDEIAPTSFWQKLINQMRADGHPYLGKLEELMGLHIPQLNNEKQRRRFGITLDEARALCDIARPALETTEPDITQILIEQSHV